LGGWYNKIAVSGDHAYVTGNYAYLADRVSGTYLVRLKTGSAARAQKLMLVR